MMTTDSKAPFMATHVGEFIKDELQERGMSQRELSGLTGIQPPIINDIVKGKRSLTPEMAVLLEKALDIPAYIFMNIQTNYELDNARISQRVAEQTKAMEVWAILEQFICLPFLKKMKCVGKDVKENVHNVLAMFGVSNIDEFLTLHAEEAAKTYFKKSTKLKADPNALFCWKYYCFNQANSHPLTTPFRKEDTPRLCERLNEIFSTGKNAPELTRQALEDFGIRLLITEKADNVPVDAFSFWQGDNPTIALTFKGKSFERLSFTIFHELGHICMHLHPHHHGIIHFAEESYPASIENEANQFAADAMAPRPLRNPHNSSMRKPGMEPALQIMPVMHRFSSVQSQ